MVSKGIGWAALALYAGSVLAANWAVATFGVVNVLGIAAPAGVLFAGLGFSLRDAVQEALGRRWAVAGILAGAALSAAVSGPLALASGAAFLLSELLDFAVYTPLRARSWAAAVALSNTAGAVVDSAIFLELAFGSLAYLPGQVWGKTMMVLPVVAWRAVQTYRAAQAQRVAAPREA